MYNRFIHYLLGFQRYDPVPKFARLVTVLTRAGRDFGRHYGWFGWMGFRVHGCINPLIHWFPKWRKVRHLNDFFADIWIQRR